MKKANFTHTACFLSDEFITIKVGRLSSLVMFMAFMLGSFTISAQNPCPATTLSSPACNDDVQVSLDVNGQVEITADMLLENANVACNSEFTVSLNYPNLAPAPNPLDCSHIGQSFTALVTSNSSGNSCWSTITIEDKEPPVIDCQPVTISCTEEADDVPPPSVTDNCDYLTDYVTMLLVNETLVDDDPCDDNQVVIHREWSAVDGSGNQAVNCIQIINIQRPTQIDFPDDITWQCHDYDDYPNVIEATPLTGSLATTGSGIPLDFDGVYCMYGYTYWDEVLETCSGAAGVFKIVRTWTVLDWCTGSVILGNLAGEDNLQTIKVIDEDAPILSAEDVTVTANVPGIHPAHCASTGFIPGPTIEDNCTDIINVQIFTPLGEAIYVNGVDGSEGGFIPSPGLDLIGCVAPYTITYKAEDQCGNIGETTSTVVVVDDLAPGVICDEITEVDLSSDGLAVVFAETFDDGSSDNCCIDGFAVRRMDDNCGTGTAFGPSVTFCCADVANNPIMVEFQVTDCCGNTNTCMVDVLVEDKITPILISCPPNPPSITCDDYWLNYEAQLNLGNYSVLDGFGLPQFGDNCDVEVEHTVTVNIDQCGVGSITRTWSADDTAGNGPVICSQTIQTTHVSDFEVQFPADVTVTCTNQTITFEEPTIFLETCELVAVSSEDQIFTVVQDACYKIVRNWVVINWCNVGDVVADELPDPLVGLRRYRDGGDGYIQYEQVVKVVDEVDPEFDQGCDIPNVGILDNTCGATVTLPEPSTTDCSTDVTVTVESDLGSGFGPFVNVAPGTYNVTYTASDNCGNNTTCETTVTVEDDKNPSPYCVNGLVIELMNTEPPMIEIWANDFDFGSFDNCPGDLQISFSSDVTHVSEIYECLQIGTNLVQIWITDAAGNQDFCETTVTVQDNMGICPVGDPLISMGGSIANENDESIEGVEVTLGGTTSGTATTGNDGMFQFADIPQGGDYTISALLDNNPLNGVSTFDLVLISKHILGVTLLDSPYKIIAADANQSNSVTTLDMVEIRKLILQINTTFSNTTSWRFVDGDFTFPEPTNPFSTSFPELLNFNNVPSNLLTADFVGIKTGDVNGSAVANNLLGSDDRNTNGKLVFNADDIDMEAGNTYQVDITANDFNALGYQFSMQFDKAAVSFVEVTPGIAGLENFGFALLDEGVITTSWNSNEPRVLANDEVLFSLTFNANTNTQLSNVLNINSNYTNAEAYNGNAELLDVNLAFNGKASELKFELYQNTPNPFSQATSIGFNLPQAGQATLTIMDMSGKVLNTVAGEYAKGYNEISIDRSNLTNGVLYYQLDTPRETATMKMIMIK